jgi:hypothetical protein
MSLHDEIIRREHLELAGREFQEIARLGHPTVGWEGDPWLSVYYNKILDCFEVWDEQIPDKPRIEVRSKPGLASVKKLDPTGLAVMLNKGDLRRKDMRKRLAEIEEHNENLERAVAKAHAEQRADAAERVMHGLLKDVGHLY